MANEAYIRKGSALLINGEGSANYALTAEGLTNVNGRVSAQIDLGASPRAAWYHWSCKLQFQATPTQGKGLEIYGATAPDGASSQVDGDVGVTNAALADADQRRNLKYIGYVAAEEADTTVMTASGTFECTERYLSIVIYNDSGASINATAANFKFYLTPIYWQGQ